MFAALPASGRPRIGCSRAFDAFQFAACASLEAGNSVLVAAPTGAGKTLIAEFAIYLAMQGTPWSLRSVPLMSTSILGTV